MIIMRLMKNSKIMWIGEIPEGWDTNNIGNLYSIRNEKVSDKDYEPLSVTKFGIVPQLDTAAKTNDGDNRKLVKTGDFVINSRSDRRGSCGISPMDGSVSLINTVLSPRGQMNPAFYNWLFHTESFADEFYKWGHGIVDDLWTTRWQEMKRISIIAPPLSEQQKIADYLDRKCSEIDKMIALEEKIIEELKAYKQSVITEAVTKGLNPDVPMKDSGIEWIGKIPERWEVCRLKNYFTLHGRIGWNGLRSDEFEENSYAYLVTGQDFTAKEIDWNRCYQIRKERYDEDEYIQLSDGDILVTKDGTIGKIAVVTRLNKPACLNSGIFVVKPKYTSVFNPNYFYWLLESPLLKSFNNYMNLGGTTIIHLYQNIFERMPLVIPSKKEQKAIADYLDHKCSEIDSLINIKLSKIDSLKDYKKSIIYEYVTGKREVNIP